jgi:DNA primase
MIKQNSVQQVLDTAKVEEVLGDFITLRRFGANYKSNCPFHDEKTPSFVISPSKGIYKCFGCGASGNSVKFLMNHEKMSFVDAVRYLAKKYSITLEETEDTQEEKENRTLKESLLIVNEYSTQFFNHNLLSREEGKIVGLSYFKERGLSPETIEAFKLGYCMDSWDDYNKTALKSGYKEEYLIQLGLVRKNEDGTLRDFYKGRIIFPILNLSGKPIGFGARTLKKDDKAAKYFNSPESEIYSKSKVLYGLHVAKKSIVTDGCILVEGYMDVLQLYQAGIHNVVSSSGTSLTEDQIKLIKRFTENITILYDGDQAGIKAAIRGMELVLQNGMNVKLALLPDNHDPDSYVKAHGGMALKSYIDKNAKDIITFQAYLYSQEAGNDPVKKSELVRDMIKTISLVKDPIKRSFYQKECAILMQVDEDLLARETQKTIVQQRLKAKKEETPQLDAAQDEANWETDSYENLEDMPRSSRLHMVEIELCRVLLEYGDKVFDEHEKITILLVYFLENLTRIAKGCERSVDPQGSADTSSELQSVDRTVALRRAGDQWAWRARCIAPWRPRAPGPHARRQRHPAAGAPRQQSHRQSAQRPARPARGIDLLRAWCARDAAGQWHGTHLR